MDPHVDGRAFSQINVSGQSLVYGIEAGYAEFVRKPPPAKIQLVTSNLSEVGPLPTNKGSMRSTVFKQHLWRLSLAELGRFRFLELGR